jgi:hypothetical protein
MSDESLQFSTENNAAEKYPSIYDNNELATLEQESHTWNSARKAVYELVESRGFNYFMLGIIVFNGFILGLQSYPSNTHKYEWYFLVIDNIFLGIYIWEVLVKVFATRMHYFYSYWNLFDIVIVSASIATWIYEGVYKVSELMSGAFRIIRVFRMARIIRFLYELKNVRALWNLQTIISAIFNSLDAISVIGVMAGVLLCKVLH